jgi:hypothetical protein
MFRLLVALILLAGLGFALEAPGNSDGLPAVTVAGGNLRVAGLVIEPFSFLLGFALGALVIWLIWLPWAEFRRAFRDALLGWRRAFVLVCLAAACTGVLLFY